MAPVFSARFDEQLDVQIPGGKHAKVKFRRLTARTVDIEVHISADRSLDLRGCCYCAASQLWCLAD
jgi:hypothetical protein